MCIYRDGFRAHRHPEIGIITDRYMGIALLTNAKLRVKREDVILATAWEIIRRYREQGRQVDSVSLYDLTKALARLSELGVDLGLEFVEYSFGPYSPELEPVLEDLAEKGLAEYWAEIHVPHAPEGVDPDYAWAIIEHQLSERDADRKYVRKKIRPRKEAKVPPDIAEKIKRAVNDYLRQLTN